MKLIDWDPYLTIEIKCNDDYRVPPYFQNYEQIFYREAKYEHCTFSFSVSKYAPPNINLNNNRSTITMSYNCKYNYNPKRKFGYWLPEPGEKFPRITVHQNVKLQKAERKERAKVARKERAEVAREKRAEVAREKRARIAQAEVERKERTEVARKERAEVAREKRARIAQAKVAWEKRAKVARKERIEVERNFVSPVGRDCFFAPSMAFRPVNKTMPSAPPATFQDTETVVTLAEERTANHDSRLFSFNFSIGKISFNTNCTICPIL